MNDISKIMSQRLITLSEMLRDESGNKLRVADVGCDHGYVSIYLIQKDIARSAIAMDVRRGPLSGAEANIRAYGLEAGITTRLSDGIKELNKGEADTLVIAGMGGKLMMSILEGKDLKELGIKTALLQPQSDIPMLRQYIRDKGYSILDERIIFEEGKYYFPMKISTQGGEGKDIDLSNPQLLRVCNRYGECNIMRRDPLLLDYLSHGREVCETILSNLNDEGHRARRKEVEEELFDISFTLKYMEE